jgi:tRNA pseudouridine55 synthase
MKENRELEGVLLIDKPCGLTSHDVVDKVRRKLKMKRIGHAGTLDPMATGLLIMLVGKATKLSQYLMSLDKTYEGTIKLGESTNTYDGEGEVMTKRSVPSLTLEEVAAVVSSYLGDQYQKPPMFSAVKINGQPLYKMARQGKEVERGPRFIRISRFDVVRFDSPEVDFSLDCTKGTYVRSLANDIGEKIGCGGYLSGLRRIASDKFNLNDAITLERFLEATPEEISKALIGKNEALPNSVL